MKERVRIFTDVSGASPKPIEPHVEDEINDWLAATPGQFLRATQSESRGDKTCHLTICVWYIPADADDDATSSDRSVGQ